MSGSVPLQDQSLGNWRIKRQVLEGEEIAYKFTPKYVLRAGQTVTVGGCRREGGLGRAVVGRMATSGREVAAATL